MTIAMSWSKGLVKSIGDQKNCIISSDIAVVIKDLYPKAKNHYLVVPWEDIPTIFDLNKEHLHLLDELYLLALNVVEVENKNVDYFKIGFHAQPSMERLHLHVISKDFVSDCLKTKKHWNSFNTDFFRNFLDVYNNLKDTGCIRPWSQDNIQRWTSAELKCNQCEFVAKNMPTLKDHLLKHWQKS